MSDNDDNVDFVDLARLGPVAGAKRTSVASGTASVLALAFNPDRRGVMAVNTDANACYLTYGTVASATDFTVKIPSDGYWEMPQPIYLGPIFAIWAGDGAGLLYLTEL